MSANQSPDLRRLSDFQGSWALVRYVTPAHGPVAHFKGTAVWHPENGGLMCKEQGVMMLEGHAPMRAERRYFWAPDLQVYFEDGRFFHQVPAEGGGAGHWCDPDQYEGMYDFSDWPGFRVIWTVTGPRKDYRSVSEYSRK